jgi:hypothetical protein
MRSRAWVVVIMGLITSMAVTLVVSGATPGAAATTRSAPGDVVVGQLTLHHCKVVKRGLCGGLLRPWDPTGGTPGNIPGGLRPRTRPRPQQSRAGDASAA